MKKKLCLSASLSASLAVLAAGFSFYCLKGWPLVLALTAVGAVGLASFVVFRQIIGETLPPGTRVHESLEEQVRRSNAFLDSIVENIPDMIFVKDARELRFVLFNKAGEDLLGYSRADLIGKNDHDFFPKSEADFFTAKDRDVLNRGQLVDIDEEPIHTKGGLRILHTKKIPLIDADGRPQYLLGISEDITAKKTSERLLGEKKRELDFANREKEQMELFATFAAHDLREPLQKISSFGDLLSEHVPPESPGREYLQRMQNASQRMGRLIDDLLRFTRVIREEVKSETIPVDGAVRDVLQDLDLLVAQTGAQIEIGWLPALETGRIQVQEVFRNLLGNALKFRKPGVPPRIVIQGRLVENGAAEISVRDNGIGFDQQDSDRIFRPFERLHPRRQYDGSGFGLAICQKILGQMNATISAISEKGEGATFTLRFPADIVRADASIAAQSGHA